mmetsp:Transcript_36342/g.106351  ORF Transcript_36342/g.106351 Transcript_36342/m.106351 type:complete len:228 (-) Transcript_36342:273-956(-)|eukprot:2691730-Prymnesium_polylepis.1
MAQLSLCCCSSALWARKSEIAAPIDDIALPFARYVMGFNDPAKLFHRASCFRVATCSAATIRSGSTAWQCASSQEHNIFCSTTSHAMLSSLLTKWARYRVQSSWSGARVISSRATPASGASESSTFAATATQNSPSSLPCADAATSSVACSKIAEIWPKNGNIQDGGGGLPHVSCLVWFSSLSSGTGGIGRAETHCRNMKSTLSSRWTSSSISRFKYSFIIKNIKLR